MTQTTCPECQTPLQAVTGFVTWCHACEWNLEPDKAAPAKDMFELFYQRLSSRLGQALFESLKGQNLMEASPHGRAWYLAMGLSATILGLYLVTWILGLWILLTGWGQPIKMIGGTLVLAMGVFAWPWKRQRFPEQKLVSREQAPQLYALLDQICELLQTPRLAGVVLTSHFNASVRQFGWRRRNVMYLGLPLWEMLSPAERLNLLGHEIGHLINGDPLHHRLPVMAIQILFQTGHAICPDKLLSDELVYGRRVMAEQWAAVSGARLVMIPVNLALALIARGFWAVGHLLLGMLWAESQRAEYRADLFGMQLAGLEAALSEMEKWTGADLVWSEARQRVHRGRIKASQDSNQAPPVELFEAIRLRWAGLPASEHERRQRLLRRENHRLDATHPATVYRMEMLRAQHRHLRPLQVSDQDWQTLDQELAPLRQQIAQKLVDQVRNSLYA